MPYSSRYYIAIAFIQGKPFLRLRRTIYLHRNSKKSSFASKKTNSLKESFNIFVFINSYRKNTTSGKQPFFVSMEEFEKFFDIFCNTMMSTARTVQMMLEKGRQSHILSRFCAANCNCIIQLEDFWPFFCKSFAF